MSKILLHGTEAICEGAIRNGCRAFFGYPITPQNEVPEYMSVVMPKIGGTFVQAESEVAAINMVYGAGGAGVRAMMRAQREALQGVGDWLLPPRRVVVAVDASVGNLEHVGYVTLGKGSLKPGLGVSKDLCEVGDIFITGIVGSSRSGDPLMLQSIRLSIVMRLADCISRSICLGMNVLERRVENFWREPAPF